ncbi:MAG: hypothetical protein AAF993_22595, partial [Pseudomonadota bacterium]
MFTTSMATLTANKLRMLVGAGLAAAALSAPTAFASALADHVGFLPGGPGITVADVEQAQKGWGEAVVAIGEAGKDAPAVAEAAAKSAYAFDLGPIQFKPTLAAEQPFRPDLEGSLKQSNSGYLQGQDERVVLPPAWA